MREVFPEIADQPFFALLDQVYTTGERFVAQGASVRLDTTELLIDFIYEPIREDRGAVTGIFVEGHDVTRRLRAERALQDSEQRFRAVANLVPDMLWSNDATGCTDWFNQRWYDYTGLTFEALHGNRWIDVIHPDDRASALATYRRALAAGEHQHRIRRRDSAYRWHLVRVEPVRGDGRVAAGFGTVAAIDDLKRLQQHQHLLLAELQHRVRNTLAVVRSLVQRSSEYRSSLADYVRHLEGRVAAFARTQAYVTRDPLRGVSLAAILTDEFAAHGAGAGEQLTIEGPEVRLRPAAADKMSLAIHQLATNSVKYGPLGAGDGRIAVAWQIVEAENGPSLLFDWVETVASDPGRPSAPGFGTELLTRSLPYELGATTKLDHTATGVRFRLEVPIARLSMPEMSGG